MDKEKAIEIFKRITGFQYTVDEKEEAIKIVLDDKELKVKLSKDEVFNVLRWCTNPLIPRWVERVEGDSFRNEVGNAIQCKTERVF